MTFNSIAYAAFLPAVWIMYWGFPRRFRRPLLLIASYVFYGAWDYRFLLLLWFSTVVDYWVGLRLGSTTDEGRRRALLAVSITVQVGILATFKYAGFFVDSAALLLERVGVVAGPGIELALPVGISFYTFQTISYTVDVFRRRVEPCADFSTFALFVAYFPQLVAGPIERAKRLLPQLEKDRPRPEVGSIQSGLSLILLGLFKKVALADPVAPIADDAFRNAESATTVQLILGIMAFGLQIYGDFSGYTDIARGSSRLFGIELMPNFRQPYLSTSITEFWQRWHVSLSQWLRDYIYIPLGGNRGSKLSTYRNLLLTMLLGGLWHGASWTFVAWGGLHGVFLAAHRWSQTSPPEGASFAPRGRASMSVAGTFMAVHLAWIFFRAPSFETAFHYLAGIASLRGGLGEVGHLMHVFAACSVMLIIDLAMRSGRASFEVMRKRPIRLGFVYGSMTLAIIIFSGTVGRPFIYFRF